MFEVKADIIVLTWNHKELTRGFVESFFSHTGVSCRLIIIDNASTDGTQEYLNSLKSKPGIELEVVFNTENVGFVKGMNQGIALSRAPFVCLANNDLKFTANWLEELIAIFENNPDIGLLNPYSNNIGAYPPSPDKIDEFGRQVRENFKSVFVEMPFCIGFCLAVRRKVIEKIGGLSEEFSPFYFEDTDYSLKAANAGFLIGLAKGAYVWHEGHASLSRLGSRNQDYFDKSKETFRRKWGRTLKVIYQANSEAEMKSSLKDAVRLARRGHYVWLAVQGLKSEPRSIFNDQNTFEHAGIKFMNYFGLSILSLKILFKKKRFDALVTANRPMRWVFSKLGYETFPDFDLEKIDSLKFKERP